MSKPKESSPNYPTPGKGDEVTCLGCKKGKVLQGNTVRDCRLCKGKGFIIAK